MAEKGMERRGKGVELCGKAVELWRTTVELSRKTVEQRHQAAQLRRTTVELCRKTVERSRQAAKPGAKAVQPPRKTVERSDRSVQLRGETVGIARVTAELTGKAVQARRRRVEISDPCVRFWRGAARSFPPGRRGARRFLSFSPVRPKRLHPTYYCGKCAAKFQEIFIPTEISFWEGPRMDGRQPVAGEARSGEMPALPRKARVEFEGALYRVLDRGNRREAIFRDEADIIVARNGKTKSLKPAYGSNKDRNSKTDVCSPLGS